METINISLNGKDNLSPVVKSAVSKSTISLKQMGADISNVGMRLSAAFTLPVTLFAKSMITFGKSASDQLAKLQSDMAAAVASGDIAKIQAAGLALDNMTVGAKKAAGAYNEMRDAMMPVNAAIDQAKGDLMAGLVPILLELKPALMNVVDGIKSAVNWFVALPVASKETILAFVGLAVAVGPALVIIGQIITVVGTVSGLLGSMGIVVTGIGSLFTAVLLPIGAFIAAVSLLGKVIADNWADIQKAAAVAIFAVTGKMPDFASNIKETHGTFTVADWQGRASGGDVTAGHPYMVGEHGPEPFIPPTNGTIIPNGAMGGGGNVYFTYAPAVSLASKAEAENVITPAILSILHKRGLS